MIFILIAAILVIAFLYLKPIKVTEKVTSTALISALIAASLLVWLLIQLFPSIPHYYR